MPRKAREKSATGIYHIMLRGINQQQIFADDEDYANMIRIIKEYKDVTGVEIYAYCLMGNHIHLLVKENETEISQFIKRIGTKFVYWYNLKYKRIGHLFQGRFRSETVKNNNQFITVIRYIHQNPRKAGLVSDISEYRYSSYREYLEAIKGKRTPIIDSTFVFEIIPKNSFSDLNERETEEKCLDIETVSFVRLTDQEAVRMIEKITKCKNAADFQKIDPDKQQKYVNKLHYAGVSVRQLSRLCGISKGMVEKYLKT